MVVALVVVGVVLGVDLVIDPVTGRSTAPVIDRASHHSIGLEVGYVTDSVVVPATGLVTGLVNVPATARATDRPNW